MFGDSNEFNTLVHIPVHAVQKAIYFDLLKIPERYEAEIQGLKDNNANAYLKSWDYVNANDYHKIIRDLKDLYSSLKTTKAIT